jgi:benzodiazapine receptor
VGYAINALFPMSSENELKQSPDLRPAIRILTWCTTCYLFSLVSYYGTSQGLWFWFVSLRRPPICPPGWSITPIWTILYGLMAWASWEVWESPTGRERTTALCLFFAQLSLNALWPWLYFALHLPIPAVVVLSVTFVLSVLTAIAFWKINPKSGGLFVPTAVWSGFLAILYFIVWRMNR